MFTFMNPDSSRIRRGIFILFAIATGSSFAQNDVFLDPLVVTATRSEQPLSDVLSDVTVIDDFSLSSGPWSTVGELLQSISGLESASHGSSFVSIRGAESRMSLVLIDGVRVDRQDGYINGGGAPWQLLSVDLIERVEVLRGAAGGVYGADAMGGVIQLFTRDGRGKSQRSASIGMSSHNTSNARVGIAGRNRAWNYAVGASVASSDGYDPQPNVVHTPRNLNWKNYRYAFVIGKEISSKHHLGLRMTQTKRASQNIPWNGGSNIDVNSTLSTTALNWEAHWSDTWSSIFSLTEARTEVKETSPRQFQTVGRGLLWDNTLSTEFGRLKLALEYRQDTLDTKADLWSPPQKGKRHQKGLSVGWTQEWNAISMQLNARVDDDQFFGSQSTWGGALGYRLTQNWRIHAGMSTGYRSPTLSQLVDPTYGDPNLKPEKAQSSELGLRYLVPRQEWQAVLHQSKFDNLISSRPFSDPTCPFCWYNVASAKTEGLSLSGRFAAGASLFTLAMDWLDARNAQTGKRLNLRSDRKLALSWQAPWRDWTVRNEWLVKSARFDDAANLKRLPGYGLWNIAATKDLSDGWSVQTRLENILDKSYEEIKDIQAPGRRWFIGLSWTSQ